MAGQLDGKVAIVTGAARGMGAAHARRFVAEGARVVLTDVLDGSSLADELGAAATFVTHDVTDPAGWTRAVEAAEAYGPLTVLVNNAAVHWTRRIESTDVDDLRRMLDINLVGAFLGMQSVIDPMRRAGGGSIVNISSTAGLTGLAYHGAYGASKWAVRGITKTAAIELGPDGIRVNSVHPGPIKTDMLPVDQSDEAALKRRFAGLPLGRPGEPHEVSALVTYLASDASSFQTGAEFVIDGGSQAGPPMAPR